MTQEWFSAKELVEACGLPRSIQGIIKRAAREAWQSRPRAGRGGGKEYHISSLSQETQIEIARQAAEAQVVAVAPEVIAASANDSALYNSVDVTDNNTENLGTQSRFPTENRVMSPDSPPTEKVYPDIPPAKIFNKAMAKAGLVQVYLDHLKVAPRGNKAQAREDFASAYNTGLLCPEAFKKLGATSWKSIERWKTTISKKGDALSLADMRGHRLKGRTIITQDQATIVLGCVLSPNKPKISSAIRQAKMIMDARGIENGFAESTYRRWLDEWRSSNNHLWVFFREGEKALNDKVSYYIERDYDKIEVGDILVADGHTLNFETLNPWTGKPKRMTLILFYDMKSNMPLGWEIMPTEDTQAISSALRRAIIALGKIPKVVYLDNGRAFKSRFFKGSDFDEQSFTGIYAQLGIRTIFAWAYHGQSKTVERFFGTFADLETMMPTYVGTSIAHKPPRMNRGEKLHRKLWDKATGGICPTLLETHHAIGNWFDTYANRPQRGHLAGQAPIAVFDQGKGPGIDKSELSLLMMAQQIRKVTRAGISFRGRNYYHPELYGLTTSVTIRYDLTHDNSVLVYDEHGKYVCEASVKAKVHPAAQILGNEADQKLLSEQLELKKGLDKEAHGPAMKLLEKEILPAVEYQMKNLGVGRDEGGRMKDEDPPALALSDAEAAEKLEAELAELTELNKPQAADIFGEIERLDGDARYEKLIEVEVRGLLVPQAYQAWMRYFEQTPAYNNNIEYYEMRRAQLAVEWQSEIVMNDE